MMMFVAVSASKKLSWPNFRYSDQSNLDQDGPSLQARRVTSVVHLPQLYRHRHRRVCFHIVLTPSQLYLPAQMLRTRNQTSSEHRYSGPQCLPSDPLRCGIRFGGSGKSSIGGPSSKTEIRIKPERRVDPGELYKQSASSYCGEEPVSFRQHRLSLPRFQEV